MSEICVKIKIQNESIKIQSVQSIDALKYVTFYFLLTGNIETNSRESVYYAIQPIRSSLNPLAPLSRSNRVYRKFH